MELLYFCGSNLIPLLRSITVSNAKQCPWASGSLSPLCNEY